MDWRVELADIAKEDLRAIFRHLFSVHHHHFGKRRFDAADAAEARVAKIASNATRLAKAPHIGTHHRFDGRDYRHVTIDRAVYWFALDDGAQAVRILGIFHGGQDHLDRMMARLTAEGGG